MSTVRFRFVLSSPTKLRELGSLLRIHARGGLVEEQELRLGRQRPRDLETALVTVGEIPREVLVAALEGAESQELARVIRCFPLLAPDARCAKDRANDATVETSVHAHEHVLERGHLLEEPDVLEGAADAELRDRVWRLAGHIRPVEDDFPPGRLVDTGEHVEERRLSRSIRPDQADDGADRDREVHVVDGDQSAELLPDVDGLEQVRRRGAHPRASINGSSWTPSSSSRLRRPSGMSPTGRKSIISTMISP